MSTQALLDAALTLRADLDDLSFPEPVACTYQPLHYAWEGHRAYLEAYAQEPKKIIFLGMNPGPFGMAQTGVPFGEIAAVRDWMGLTAPITSPPHPHPKRPILGFDCPRSEVSGRRLWGLFAERFGPADAFFADHLVLNFCPLLWMRESGANLTPVQLPRPAFAPVEAACRQHLITALQHLRPQACVGIGGFAETQLHHILPDLMTRGLTPTIGKILHPSPASPAANRGFAEAAIRQMQDQGLWSA